MIFTEDMTEDDMLEENDLAATAGRGSGNELSKLTNEELEAKLMEALNVEDYQKAAVLRDELNKRK